ncbi:flagella basal body P-ring formation protein FlgA [Pluralibacter gergoviae]|uniref:flagellar basal body P-ring formation chaperone FlgA n=1 Tax=Pluralibacter gergoviae TaxID=61647 RepID=UPI0006971EF4|nr:flagellar basal body P-ring formation chaperone FlgA [Pluralibacter gergoviae]OUQ99708.1 flagella basal body P-ring formation protein FlgA [Pluralibacter gergoviae]
MEFRQLTNIARQKKKDLFRFTGLFFLLLWLHNAAAAQSAGNARKQIYVAAQLHASELIRKEAKLRGWSDYSAKMNLFIPADASRLPPCARSPFVTLSGDRADIFRLRLDVRCEEGRGWNTVVTVKPDISVSVVTARRSIERGETLSADNITVEKVNIAATRGSAVLHADDIIGLTVKRRIRPQQPVTLSLLDLPLLVNRGQRVTMIAEQDGVQAQTVGEAMKKGRKGDVIKVKNERSGRVVSAVVADAGVVKMTQAGG